MLFCGKKSLLVTMIFALLLLLLVYLTYLTHRDTYYLPIINTPKTSTTQQRHEVFTQTKYILYWSPFWTIWDYLIGYGYEPFKDCEYKNCYTTKNRTLLPLEKIDALLYHTIYHKKNHGVPSKRLPHQMYILMNLEAPFNKCPDLKQYASYFNWTMSYRFDSDIVRRHGYFSKEETGYKIPSEQSIQNKTKLAAWFVSHCPTPSQREVLGKEIQEFMQVDVYGKCGKLKCATKAGNKYISSEGCYNMVEKKYKFYFSWENSYCTDYATEKLYKILVRDIVPVVYGRCDYKLSMPPNSVINVEDFESASKLAEYLKYLDQNPDEYLKYLEWKRHYRLSKSILSGACEMCKKLHEPIKESVYHDLYTWWWGSKDKPVCKKGKDLPRIVSDLL